MEELKELVEMVEESDDSNEEKDKVIVEYTPDEYMKLNDKNETNPAAIAAGIAGIGFAVYGAVKIVGKGIAAFNYWKEGRGLRKYIKSKAFVESWEKTMEEYENSEDNADETEN